MRDPASDPASDPTLAASDAGEPVRSSSAPTRPSDADLDGSSRTMPASSPAARPLGDTYQASVDRFVAESELGRGGMGKVLAAHDQRWGRAVAIKVLLHPVGTLRDRFEREARITARLQHPSVVPVYSTGESDGSPFYVMKRVTGRTLAEALRDAASQSERLTLLPSVLAVAEAIAYAHQEGVIHRDLKPQNILVGTFGETVVIDWGLAKELRTQDVVEEVAPRPAIAASGDGDLTEAGDTLGTPAYMPPEQAAGLPVDERADVYALGAILYELLAGARPYAGTAGEILLALAAGPPPPLSADAPADLRAIVAKAMARDPAARYRSARELADDLRMFQTGQLVGAYRYTVGQLLRRWVRRHRPAVGVTAIAMIAVAIISVVSIVRVLKAQERAERERKLALVHRGEAEALLEFNLHDLGEKLESVGRLDLLESVARNARDYYRRRGSEGTMAADRRATAFESLGNVFAARGDTTRALVELRAALVLREAMSIADPDNRELQHTLFETHRAIGEVLATRGERTDALGSFRIAHHLATRAVARDPARLQAQADLAAAHADLGDALLAQGERSGALEQFRSALEILGKVAAPTGPWRNAMANARQRLADVLVLQGDTAGALREFQLVVSTREGLIREEPQNASYQHDLSGVLTSLSSVQFALGDSTGALSAQQRASSLLSALVVKDPSNGQWQRDHASSLITVGDMQDDSGQTRPALASYRAALDIARALAARDAANAEWQHLLATAHESVANILLALEDWQGSA